MKFPKPSRIKDRALLDERIRGSCVVCGKSPCDPEHIGTKGAGNDDVAENCWSLCRLCHVEKGTVGLTTFVQRHHAAKFWLKAHGWTFDEFMQKWVR